MELEKIENDYDRHNYEGKTSGEYEVRLFVGQEYGPTHTLDGKPVYDIMVDMPHQCDAWEVAYGRTTDVPQVIAQLEAHIVELQEVLDYMRTDRFAEIVKEVENRSG